jgi:hypothetical protein
VGKDCGNRATPACDCEYAGQGYAAGDTFKDTDGCNDCRCDKNGGVSCSAKACMDAGASDAGIGKVCGGLQGAACALGAYCNYAPAAHCGAADQTGTCAAMPQTCNGNYAPVCGCNGKTYANSCAAALAGTSVESEGACK